MAPEDFCIVHIFDEPMLLPAAVAIQSIADNYHDNEDLHVVCCMPEGSEQAFESLNQMLDVDSRIVLKLVTIKKSEFGWLEKASNIESRHWAPTSIDFCKLFLGTLLPEYKKAIYMDIDVMAVSNIQPILDHPINGEVMAVIEIAGAEYGFLKSRGEAAHFSNGLLIMDLNWWRTSGIEETFQKHLQNVDETSMGGEEVSNLYLGKYWSPLPFTFNFMNFTRDKYGIPNYDESNSMPWHYKHAIIFHFAGRAKPWNYKEMVSKKDKSLLGERWRRMAEAAKNRFSH